MASVSRRSLLAASAAFSMPRALHAQTAAFDTDIAIIGAGAAGLAAARECQLLQRSFVLLEARQRIGGRVFTDHSLGEPFDAGAVYIHWAESNPWAGIARGLDIATVADTASAGAFQFFERGQRQERNPRRGAAFGKVADLLDSDLGEVPDISIAERFAGQSDEMVQAAGSLARMALGEEPERVSARDYGRLWSGDDLLVPGGYGDLVARYGADLPVRLGVTVTGIDTSGAGATLATSHGTIRARHAIVTASAGVLASGAIRFTPALPVITQEGIAGIGMGALSKIALKFDGARFAIPQGTDLFNAEGAREVFDFECWGYDRNLVIVQIGGDHARAVLGLGQAGAIATALDVFCAMVGTQARAACVGGATADWLADPLALGCYSHALPGHAEARAKLSSPVAGALWFAGEATGGEDFGGAMTAGGAFLAGRDAVRAIAAI